MKIYIFNTQIHRSATEKMTVNDHYLEKFPFRFRILFRGYTTLPRLPGIVYFLFFLDIHIFTFFVIIQWRYDSYKNIIVRRQLGEYIVHHLHHRRRRRRHLHAIFLCTLNITEFEPRVSYYEYGNCKLNKKIYIYVSVYVYV